MFKKYKEKKLTVLDNINLTITRGDKIGLIGSNGAGKSTLLKIISKITYPTKGYITLYGKVGSVLEAGVGFNQQLTGVENIYLNGAILGMERKEIQKKVNQIIEFSGLSKFKDVPLKKFSTGMQIKIAFSICVFLKTEILILDEILAFIDQSFQDKCIEQILKSCKEENRTLIIVSHDLEAIKKLCDKAIYIKNGRVEIFGEVNKVINSYQ
jgi:lipopolysaccharide transport system ATP-binding protein